MRLSEYARGQRRSQVPNPAELRRGEAAAWGPRPAEMLAPARPQIKLLDFKAITKGDLRGFAAIEMPGGLRIIDCPILISNGKAWAGLPARPRLDAEGRHVKVGGKGQYTPTLAWRDRDLQNQFSDAVIRLVRAAHPDALDGAS